MNVKILASSSVANAYLLTAGGSAILLECGMAPKALQAALDFKVSSLAGCLLTHDHSDHSRGIGAVFRAGVPVFASIGTIEALGCEDIHLSFPIVAGELFRVGPFRVMPFPVEHDAAEPLGFFVACGDERLLFATDTAYIRPTFSGITHLMIECNYQEDRLTGQRSDRVRRSHFGVENVKRFIQANDMSKLKKIWLIHMSNDHANAEGCLSAVRSVVPENVEVTVA